ncbi:hypothetical protein L1987_08300 [Smallanthus sonchifolius]|uniref:Uncharacterized protein n=1 Tax=Smallanthus sonchifolius TaxID=185202 RepID=A0ACB9JNC9_9ASTR|nr:hypothetical protein L1987_08300 [Smallanthus sonchifolius]
MFGNQTDQRQQHPPTVTSIVSELQQPQFSDSLSPCNRSLDSQVRLRRIHNPSSPFNFPIVISLSCIKVDTGSLNFWSQKVKGSILQSPLLDDEWRGE